MNVLKWFVNRLVASLVFTHCEHSSVISMKLMVESKVKLELENDTQWKLNFSKCYNIHYH